MYLKVKKNIKTQGLHQDPLFSLNEVAKVAFHVLVKLLAYSWYNNLLIRIQYCYRFNQLFNEMIRDQWNVCTTHAVSKNYVWVGLRFETERFELVYFDASNTSL